jgi:tRNA G18 (ribose-2'-O)-methylase SpoU
MSFAFSLTAVGIAMGVTALSGAAAVVSAFSEHKCGDTEIDPIETRFTDRVLLAETLRAHGFESVAMALDDRAVPLGDSSLAKADKLALFFGTEGTGLTEEVLASVDRTVIIPMSHGVDSLNVAASSAVAFWELCARPRA